jgi:hypothetical protein
MLLDEWDLDTALKVERDEGRDEVLELMEQGLSAAEIKSQLAR